jgi:DNA polymerase
MDDSRLALGRAATQYLHALQLAGVTHLPKPRGRTKVHSTKSIPAPHVEVLREAARQTEPSDGDELELIRRDVAACMRCRELCSSRTQTVFGVGNPQARLCFLGEAPGADEDRQGEPFVGRAGQLLNRIIEACTMKREDVYILNILKCRPPGNRAPMPDEAANCREFLDRQLAIIRPEFICCLGAVAAQNLLETTTSISRLRKRFFDYKGSRVMCTYHPAYLLRNPAAKKDTWEDMQMLMREMGIELPAR